MLILMCFRFKRPFYCYRKTVIHILIYMYFSCLYSIVKYLNQMENLRQQIVVFEQFPFPLYILNLLLYPMIGAVAPLLVVKALFTCGIASLKPLLSGFNTN